MEDNLDSFIMKDWERSIGLSAETDGIRDPESVSMAGIETPTDTSVEGYMTNLGQTWAQMLRGYTAAGAGALGEGERLIQGIGEIIGREADESAKDAFMRGIQEETQFWTTEDVAKMLPDVPGVEPGELQMAEQMGEMIGPTGAPLWISKMLGIATRPQKAAGMGIGTAMASEEAAGASDKSMIIDELYQDFAISEGNGDTTGAAPTGKRGLTTRLYSAMKKKHGNISEEEASKLYLGEAYDKFTADLAGFDQLPTEAKKGILDSAYNMDFNKMLKFKNFAKAVAAGDVDGAFKNLLDTANINGQSSKGLAKRRAESYNIASPGSPITSVEQDANGEIRYMKGNNVFFSYTPRKGKHKSSAAGTIGIK